MVSIADGDTLIYYQNGMRWDIPIVGGALEGMHFGQLYICTSSKWTNNYTATLKYIGIADLDDTSELRYVDNLHASSTPYGCDMTLAFDIHADFSRYEMVDVMKRLQMSMASWAPCTRSCMEAPVMARVRGERLSHASLRAPEPPVGSWARMH